MRDPLYPYKVTTNELRYRKVLSNGQLATMYVAIENYSDSTRSYSITFVVSDTRRWANRWSLDKVVSNKVTGTCGIEAMLYAKQLLVSLESRLQHGDDIWVQGSDERRHSVYRHLYRLGYKDATWGGYNGYSKAI